MNVDVFAADEQRDVPVDVMRWVRLARMVLDEEQVPGGAELSLIFVDEQAIADLNERFLGSTGPTDVLAFPMDDDIGPAGRQPDQGGRGPGSPSESCAYQVIPNVASSPSIRAQSCSAWYSRSSG